jgi:hypothetical protein
MGDSVDYSAKDVLDYTKGLMPGPNMLNFQKHVGDGCPDCAARLMQFPPMGPEFLLLIKISHASHSLDQRTVKPDYREKFIGNPSNELRSDVTVEPADRKKFVGKMAKEMGSHAIVAALLKIWELFTPALRSGVAMLPSAVLGVIAWVQSYTPHWPVFVSLVIGIICTAASWVNPKHR